MRKLLTVPLTLALGLLPALASASLPDLCDDVYLNDIGAPITDSKGTKLSRFCEWTGPSAPLWADNVCCTLSGSDASCVPTDLNGRCVTGFKMWCDYAAEFADGVTCFQPLPDACAEGHCIQAPGGSSAAPSDTALCCVGANCWEMSLGDNCPGDFVFCASPFTNEDGTVGCADED